MTDLAEAVGVYTPPMAPGERIVSNILGVAFMSITIILPVVMAGGAA